jgi:hypothetical protein
VFLEPGAADTEKYARGEEGKLLARVRPARIDST